MPARNVYHDTVVNALQADGWTITHDPLPVGYGGRDLYVDLGAERTAIGAERDGKQIAVEVASFLTPSPVRDLQEAVGQYEVYRVLLAQSEPDRPLYLAVARPVYEAILSERFGQLIVSQLRIKLLVFDPQQRQVFRWIE
jgi:hypothetical protein